VAPSNAAVRNSACGRDGRLRCPWATVVSCMLLQRYGAAEQQRVDTCLEREVRLGLEVST
jgi:hypothetical protein